MLFPERMTMKELTLHLLSGGIDSTVLLYDLLKQGRTVECIGFYYGQKHVRELDFARATCRKLGLRYDVVGLSNVFSGCFLTNDGEGWVVPNRNAVLLNIAVAIAKSRGARTVTFGANRSDRDTFPDCTRTFVEALNYSISCAGIPVVVEAPYLDKFKHLIVALGRGLGVDMGSTWSCYTGSNEPCGECLACQERAKAIKGVS